MYASDDELYCYPGTNVLINKLGIVDADRLEAFEEEMTRERAAEPLPEGRLSVSHFRAVHRHLFQDIYSWAGQLRRVRIAKGSNMFCYPEHIPAELRRVSAWLKGRNYLRGLSLAEFAADTAHLLAELNAIHAFRDGNGRTQLSFVALVAARAGYPLDFERLEPEDFLTAMIASFSGDEAPLAGHLRQLAEPS